METVSRTDSPVELGQWLARQLLETPVKNAVREALEEEGIARREQQAELVNRQEQEAQQSDAADDSSTGPPVAALVAGLVAVGVVAYLLRQRGSDSDYPTRPSDVDEQTAAGDRVEAEAPVDSEN